MKKILFLICALCSMSAMAQDVIIKQNGDEIQCKLLEVGSEEIKYKRWTNLNGPTFIEERDDVFMIKYENGEKNVFGVKPTAQQNATLNSSQAVTLFSLRYDKDSESGLVSGGKEIPTNYAQSIMGNEWNDFVHFKEKREKGKHLLVWGIICRGLSTGTTIAGICTEEIPFFAVSGGLRLTSTTLMATGIVNMAKGQHGCRRLVEQHTSQPTGFNPEFDFGIGANAISLRISF